MAWYTSSHCSTSPGDNSSANKKGPVSWVSSQGFHADDPKLLSSHTHGRNPASIYHQRGAPLKKSDRKVIASSKILRFFQAQIPTAHQAHGQYLHNMCHQAHPKKIWSIRVCNVYLNPKWMHRHSHYATSKHSAFLKNQTNTYAPVAPQPFIVGIIWPPSFV